MEQSPEKLMTNQFISNQKINELLELASEYITCGPECQENKKSQELYDKYLNSQKILKMIPEKVKKNKKNYYVYTYGEEYYNEMEKKELSENAKEIISKISDEFNIQVNNALTMDSLLKTSGSEQIFSDQYPVIQEELIKQLKKKENSALVNDRETYYSDKSIKRLELWNKFLSFVYYFTILIFLILCFPKNWTELAKYLLVLGLSFLYLLFINHYQIFVYNRNFEIFMSIIYFIVLLIIILFILYKIATSFKYILISLTELLTKVYKFSN